MTSSELIEIIYDDVRELARLYPSQPLTRILPDLTRCQATVLELLAKPQRPKQAVDLYFLAAINGGMLAKAAHDQGDPVAAQSLARTATLCAEYAGHSGLQAWLCGLQALIAYWDGNPRDSIRFAEKGGSLYSGPARNSTLPWLCSSEARAWARIGNSEKAHECIERAVRFRDVIEPDELDSFGGIAEFSLSRQHYFAADALAWLPNDPEALSWAKRAVEAYRDPTAPSWAFGDSAGSQVALALAHLHNDDEDAIAEALEPVLDLPENLRINGVVLSLERVHCAVSDRPSVGKVGQSLQRRIRDYAKASVPQLPR